MKSLMILFTCIWLFTTIQAQTDNDAIMMNKHQWCNGFSYEHAQWKNYWEGTLKRDNQNIGTFTSQSVMFMTNYGITDNLNIMAGLPYIWNHVSAGTLHKMNGVQDVSSYLKWRALHIKSGKQKISLFTVAGFNLPTHNYEVDYLPLSIGLGSKSLTGRAIADYQYGKFYATASASYTLNGNTKIDRTAYYTDHLVLSDIVDMPNSAAYMLSTGVRVKYLIAEAIVTQVKTLGGFDIRRNDMPFPSNQMNTTTIGVRAKYTLPFFKPILLVAEGSKVVNGRNVGQATSFAAGAYYRFTFKKIK